MSRDLQADPARTPRRIGMSIVLVVIVWTIAAVTVGVLRGPVDTDAPPEAAEHP